MRSDVRDFLGSFGIGITVTLVLVHAGHNVGQERGEARASVRVGSLPVQVVWNSGGTALTVVESEPPRIVVVDLESGKVALRADFPVAGANGTGFVATARDGSFTAAIDPWQPRVVIVPGGIPQSSKNGAVRSIAVDPNPQALAVTPDSRRILVACDTPGLNDRQINIVDVSTGAVTRRSVPGSSNLRGIAVDPTGTYALAVHLLPKFHLPSTQIEQGWVFTNAISYVPLDESRRVVTFPLDLRTQAFANPEGVAISPDGQTAWVAHAGADLVSIVDLPELVRVVSERAAATRPVEDLRLTRRYVRARIPVGPNPRGIAVSPDGKWVAVANRLGGSISMIDAGALEVSRTLRLVESAGAPSDSPIARGERLFHSGAMSFGGQFSCASCHPDGHTDGLNWDLPADGFNNFHNTKSLLGTEGTGPYGWLGTTPTLKERFSGTLRHLFQHEPTADEADAIESYLAQLDYPRLPERVDAQSPAAQRGKALFHGKAGCAACHAGTKLTDRALHDVGTGDADAASFDTPSLVHVAETAPYLHDGRAESLETIFTRHNTARQHGEAHELSAQELAELVEYLKSL
jgi:DNA-binding beta-propeller fold protein YncE